MSAATQGKGVGARLVQAAALLVVLGVLLLAMQIAPETRSVVGTVAGLGVLLLAGTLMSELLEVLRLPHISGYLAAGFICGPYVLHLVDAETVHRLQPVNGLTVALISLAGGAELKVDLVRRTARSVLVATLVQSPLVFFVVGAAFLALAPYTPFADLPPRAIFAVAVLWAILAVSRSPTALLGIFSQLRPKGPLAEFSLAFVMFSNLVVIVMMAVGIALVRPLLDSDASLSLSNLGLLGRELLGSATLGITLGIALAVYLRLVGQNLLLVLLVLGVGVSELLRYIQLDAMLAFLVAGFVVENFSAQGPKLLKAIENTGAVVYVIFFALAGAHLDLPALKMFYPVALTLCLVRCVATWGAAVGGSWFARDQPVVRRWGWSGLVAQAGLALGLSTVVVRAFPSVGIEFQTMAIAVIAINEVIGPMVFKLGLDRAGESRSGDEPDAPPSSTRN